MSIFKGNDVSPELEQAKNNLVQAENELQQKLTQLGQMYYVAHKEDTDAVEFSDVVSLVKKLDANRVAFYQNYLRLQGKMMCIHCEEVIPYGSCFCNKCGKSTTTETTV